jgi:hypothetical protein
MFKYAFLFIKPLRIGDDVAGSWLYIEILKNKKENIHCPTIMFGSIMFTIHKSAGVCFDDGGCGGGSNNIFTAGFFLFFK